MCPAPRWRFLAQRAPDEVRESVDGRDYVGIVQRALEESYLIIALNAGPRARSGGSR